MSASWSRERSGCVSREGCLAFLREFPDGARIVAGIPQLLDDLGLIRGSRTAALAPATITVSARPPVGSPPAWSMAWRRWMSSSRPPDLPVATVLATLTLLERDRPRRRRPRSVPAGRHARGAASRRTRAGGRGPCPFRRPDATLTSGARPQVGARPPLGSHPNPQSGSVYC